MDQPEAVMVGEGYYKLEGLANYIDNPSTINLIGSTYEIHGKLEVDIVPCTFEGNEDPDEIELIPEEPEDLIDQRIDFKVKVKSICDLP
jgi:kinesin family protein 13